MAAAETAQGCRGPGCRSKGPAGLGL
ncbi:unnamed protein product [Menidia menidia]|uniref:(Atlantic silverside) hypothetical protein n=1 Tax=Menidia menidia TaxID=238744 RepID=A0A8S4AXV0_9TELE|nr:unnamed protein product [Menidia menidia]